MPDHQHCIGEADNLEGRIFKLFLCDALRKMFYTKTQYTILTRIKLQTEFSWRGTFPYYLVCSYFLFHFILVKNPCCVQPTTWFSCLTSESRPAVGKTLF